MKKQLLAFLIAYSTYSIVIAQNDSTRQQEPNFKVSGFLDVFYFYDFNEPQGAERQPFLFNHNRHNEFNVNLGLAKLGIDHYKFRANFAIQTGTYANDNYAAEPGVLKNIFEANIGLSLNKKNSLWIDAGIFPSHLGFESALSSDNMTLTRSLSAESSPYYLSGTKLTFNPSNRWEIAALISNGWQRIQRLEGNSMLSFGTQINYHPTNKLTLNWSTFIGTDDPDTTRRIRYFNNFYGLFNLTNKIDLIAGFDVGVQQKFKGSSTYNTWWVPVIISRYSISSSWKCAVRAEYFQDKNNVIISTGTINGFQTIGISFNLDYLPTSNIMCRFEGRWFNSRDSVFESKTNPTNNNFIIGASIAIKFPETTIN